MGVGMGIVNFLIWSTTHQYPVWKPRLGL